jgi:hypothetical protein
VVSETLSRAFVALPHKVSEGKCARHDRLLLPPQTRKRETSRHSVRHEKAAYSISKVSWPSNND